ncbi:MAG: patatin-like phospholipase family protein [Syntrophales bacterium]
MKRFHESHLVPLLIALLFIVQCAHYRVNSPLAEETKDTYDFSLLSEPRDSDETFVVLTFSGGGTRAAALAYGVLEKMSTILLPGTNRTLLDEVDVISTVSGGSFTGAYYALFGERIFDDFKDKFLYRNIEKELAMKAMNPANWFRLASPYFSRIDLAAELYDQTIFESLTFESIAKKKRRPFLIINATDLYQGARFEFTGGQFRYLSSDLLSYPVACAVAASSAFPFLLTPVSLVNYPDPRFSNPTAEDEMALKDYWKNRRRYVSASARALYSDKSHRYVHLMDGGLADNIGLRAVYDMYLRADIRQKINEGAVKRLLIIVVNAKTRAAEDLDKRESPPGLARAAYKTCTVSLDNYSFETVEVFREAISDRLKAQQYMDDCQELLDEHCLGGYRITPLTGGRLKIYIAELSFDNLADKEEREFFNRLPTTFSLAKDQVDRLIGIGGRLLIEHPEFRKFIDEYGTEEHP